MKKRKSPNLRIYGWGIFLAGALMLGSCTSDEVLDEQVQEQEVAIEFGKLKTRAAVKSATDIKEFGVFADMNTIPENGHVSLLENEKVYRASNADNAPFIYDNKRYWINGHTFRFFAVYPYTTNVTQTTPDGTNYNVYQIPFVTPATADTDFMAAYSTKSIANNATTYSAVDLNFNHVLSKINIKISKNRENEENKVVLKSITLSGIYAEGTYNASLDENYDKNWVITTPSNTLTIKKNFVTSETDGLELDAGGNETMGEGLLLIPQEFTNRHKVQVKIEYDFYMYDETEEPDSEEDDNYNPNRTATAYLPDAWVAGQHYTYNIELRAEDNNIRFNKPSITPWGKQSGATILIQ